MPEFMQTTFAVSLGAAYRSWEMIKSPMESTSKIFDQVKELFVIPKDAGEGFQKKLEALAGVWMEKGASLVESCKTAGEKFTEEKKK